MHAGCKYIEVFQSMYYVAQNDLYNAMNKPLTKSSGMRLEKCQDTCIVKIQASLEENMYPLERNISARTR